jgi:hypothetical protein
MFHSQQIKIESFISFVILANSFFECYVLIQNVWAIYYSTTYFTFFRNQKLPCWDGKLYKFTIMMYIVHFFVVVAKRLHSKHCIIFTMFVSCSLIPKNPDASRNIVELTASVFLEFFWWCHQKLRFVADSLPVWILYCKMLTCSPSLLGFGVCDVGVL